MSRSFYGYEAESRERRLYATERDDRQARQALAIRQQPAAERKLNTKKLVDEGSNGKIQGYRYAKEQGSRERQLYASHARARHDKEEYQAYGYQRHAKEEYQSYSSNVRAGRRSSPPPKLQMKNQNPMLKKKASSPPPKLQAKNQNTMLKKKAITSKYDDSTSSEEDEDESSSEEEEDESSSSSSSDDEATYEVSKRMSRMEVTTTKFVKTKMMKWQ